MKLYTEEEIRRTFGFGLNEISFKGYMNAMKPIELPSDEEIFEIAPIDLGRGPSIGATEAFRMGAKWMRDRAKWMRDKIQGGN